MDKKYQVFVSSTYEDLKDERKEVMQSLLEIDCLPAGMELFQASDDDQWTLIKKVIDQCDYYIVIVGGKYGSINQEGKSYTQMEYEYALNRNKPILGFLPKTPENLPAYKIEKDDGKRTRLEEFKKLVAKKNCKFWENASDLGSSVIKGIIKMTKDHPSSGWVRADEYIDVKSIEEISRLQKENAELKEKIKKNIQVPSGIANLAQGEDKIEIKFYVYDWEEGEETEILKCYSFTWNQIFKWIALSLLSDITEESLKKSINSCIIEWYKKNFQETNITAEISEESFSTIIIQFKALGYISYNKISGYGYCSLTPFGEQQVADLLAIKKA